MTTKRNGVEVAVSYRLLLLLSVENASEKSINDEINRIQTLKGSQLTNNVEYQQKIIADEEGSDLLIDDDL